MTAPLPLPPFEPTRPVESERRRRGEVEGPGLVLLRPRTGWRRPAEGSVTRALRLQGDRLDPGGDRREAVQIVVEPAAATELPTYRITVSASSDARARRLLDLALERLARGAPSRTAPPPGIDPDEESEAMAEAMG